MEDGNSRITLLYNMKKQNLPPFHHLHEGVKKQEVESHHSLSYTFHTPTVPAQPLNNQEIGSTA